MITRRNLLIVLGTASLCPQDVFAQAKKRPVVIGHLSASVRNVANISAFKSELATLGWKEGSDYVLEERYANGQIECLASLAEELAEKKPAVIVAMLIPSAMAAAKAAPQTPIVVVGGDPVATGLVASYARPGGMVTGISNLMQELSVKYLELLLGAVPKLRRVGFLLDRHAVAASLHKENMQRSAAQYAVEAHIAEPGQAEEIEPALERLAQAASRRTRNRTCPRRDSLRVSRPTLDPQSFPALRAGNGGWCPMLNVAT